MTTKRVLVLMLGLLLLISGLAPAATVRSFGWSSGGYTLNDPAETAALTVDYTAIAMCNNAADKYVAARADGGLDFIYFNGTAYVTDGNHGPSGTIFTDMALSSGTDSAGLAIAGGKIRGFSWSSGGYVLNDLAQTAPLTADYVAITMCNRAADKYIAARADGGLDFIYFNGTAYVTDGNHGPSGTVFTDVALSSGTDLEGLGITGGKIRGFSWSSGGYSLHDASETAALTADYTAITLCDKSANSYLATRADGGLDYIYWLTGTGYVTDGNHGPSDAIFTDAALSSGTDSLGLGLVVPEPATLLLLLGGLAGCLRRR